MVQRRANFRVLAAVAMLVLRAAAAQSPEPFREVASTDSHWRPEEAHLTLGGALQLAEAEAQRNKIALTNFRAPWFWFHHNNDGTYTWSFHYEGRVSAPGNDFLVIVNDRTRDAVFWPGE